jgi:hypothetical protein
MKLKEHDLKSDYDFRELVAEYLRWITTGGAERVWAHQDVIQYLGKVWGVDKVVPKNSTDGLFGGVSMAVGMPMREKITNDVYESIGYPKNGRPRNWKPLVDKFCDKLEEIKPLVLKSAIEGVYDDDDE